jgi:hypothetical protein
MRCDLLAKGDVKAVEASSSALTAWVGYGERGEEEEEEEEEEEGVHPTAARQRQWDKV